MTSEPKKRIFDEDKFLSFCDNEIFLGYENVSDFEKLKDYMESEMRRFARECLEKVRQNYVGNLRRGDEVVVDVNNQIDALIAELKV